MLLLVVLSPIVPPAAHASLSLEPALGFPTGALPASVAIGDVNGDGHPDLIVVNTGANTVSVLLGTGTGSFASKMDLPTGAVPHAVAVADLNGDGRLDIVVADTGANAVSVFLGAGDGSFGPAATFATGAAPFHLAIADVNGDRFPDLVVVNVNDDTVSVLLGLGDGSFRPKVDLPTGAGARSVAIGDVNGDGAPDLVVANISAGTVSILLGAGDGQFSAHSDLPVGSGARAVAIGDVNGDGIPDIIVANASSNTITVLPGTGAGSFGPTVDFATGPGPRDVIIADLDQDGIPDLVVANFAADTISVLVGAGGGAFAPKVDFSTGAGPFALAVADIDGDGRPDVVAADVNGNAVSVFINKTPAVLMVTPGSVNFGDVAVGRSATRDFTVTNAGAGILNGTAAASAPFSVGAGIPYALGARRSRNVTIRFRPTAAGIYSSGLSFTSNAGEVSRGVTGSGVDPVPTFADVPVAHPFFIWIETLVDAGITGGCATSPRQYCPDSEVTRGQVAVFVLRGRHGGGYQPPEATGMFMDVPGTHPFATWIEQLAREGITGGCATNPPRYCPDAPVTRGQMAVLLLRAEHGASYDPPEATGMFTDVPGTHPFAKWIEQLAREGITSGCATTPPRYCPDAAVTRGEIAVFLVRTFNLPI